jgi:large subunit ribosomal protein L25
MSEVSLKASVRLDSGKGVARKLRAAGKVPGTVYGRATEPLGVSVDARELKHLLASEGANALIDLDVEGTKHLTLAREVQHAKTRADILHVDFLVVSRDQEIVFDVPIHWVGRAAGEREGGIVEHVHTTLEVRAKATAVPDAIDVDLSELTLDHPITVASITPPEGVVILTPAEEVVAACTLPRAIEEPVLEVPAEPEVVGQPAEGEPAAE